MNDDGTPAVSDKELAEGPFYFQRIWRKKQKEATDNKTEWEVVKTMIPRKRGGRLWRRIPFHFFNAQNNSMKPGKPLLMDLCDVNHSHYMNSADLEEGRHLCSLPTPWGAGFDPKSTKFKMGSKYALVTSDARARIGMLEFTGKGLGHLASGMEHKEKQMAMLASKVLEERSKNVESVETAELRHSGEQAALGTVSEVIGAGYTAALRDWVDWISPSADLDQINIQMDMDFNPKGLTSEQMKELLASLQGGGISYDAYWYNLYRAGMYPDGHTKAMEEAAIAAGSPGEDLMTQANPNPRPLQDEE